MMNRNNSPRAFKLGALACALVLVVTALPAVAAPGRDDGRDDGRDRGRQGPEQRAPRHRAPAGRWFDGGHDHARHYPSTGVRLHALPGRVPPIAWRGSNFWFSSGVWYGPAAGGYVVVRPPYGIVVGDLPAFRTAVVIGGLTYLYLNGVYYRERVEGGYEVVASPVEGLGTPAGTPGRMYVYPKLGQSAEVQATDEYECHRWAVQQSGFDPTPAATGQATDTSRRADYVRAQGACLEGRGYTVR
jgi:hypothetical protein